jgi:hypothetical protein
LYPVRVREHPRPIIAIHECRRPKAQVADQTTTGLRRAINLPGRQPPHRGRGKPLLDLERGALRNDALFDEAPERYRELPCKRNDANLSAAWTLVTEAFVPP